jgi:hypothetical protein
MKYKNLNAGFVPIIILAIVVVVAVGGGAYYATKGPDTSSEMDSNVESNGENETSMEASGDIEMAMKNKGSLKALLSIGKNTKCSFTSSKNGYESKGTVFISSSGDMRGDFISSSAQGAVESHIVMSGDTSYSWTGNQGAKMSTESMTTANVKSENKSSVDLNEEVDYECEGWTRDNSKFEVPANVNFVDIDAMMSGMINTEIPTNIDVEAMMKAQIQ